MPSSAFAKSGVRLWGRRNRVEHWRTSVGRAASSVGVRTRSPRRLNRYRASARPAASTPGLEPRAVRRWAGCGPPPNERGGSAPSDRYHARPGASRLSDAGGSSPHSPHVRVAVAPRAVPLPGPPSLSRAPGGESRDSPRFFLRAEPLRVADRQPRVARFGRRATRRAGSYSLLPGGHSGRVMSSGLTHWSNCSGVRKPSSSAASRRLRFSR